MKFNINKKYQFLLVSLLILSLVANVLFVTGIIKMPNKAGEVKVMKVLSIGNSFSQDAHNKLYTLGVANGVEIETVNLYIGGCKLETHWANTQSNAESYDLERNGGAAERKISIEEALGLEEWDVITLQQASAQSQHFSSYTPYLENIAKYVRERCPNAKLYFHQTWAYETDYFADGFRESTDKQKGYVQQHFNRFKKSK